jgi:type II secretory pathway pseudopilin PulG
MAIVLVIVGVLLGGLLVPLSTTREQLRISDTRAALRLAGEALLGFAVIHGVLPHPASDETGVEDPTVTAEGTLPWATLGLSRADGSDAWGNPLRYRAEPAFHSPAADPPDTLGGMRVEGPGGEWTADDPDALAAVIVSLGRNGAGDGDNGDGDNRYTQGAYCIEGCSVYFDDELVMVSKHIFIARLAAAGRWP